mgnify:CR=1 FL=1
MAVAQQELNSIDKELNESKTKEPLRAKRSVSFSGQDEFKYFESPETEFDMAE